MQGISVKDLKNKSENEIAIVKNKELKIKKGWKPSIIVVGNSPDIKKYNVGKEIDKFNIVIRINDYKIEGYTKYLGNKTSIWCTNLSKYMIELLKKDTSWESIKRWRKKKKIENVSEVWYRGEIPEYEDLRETHQKYLWDLNVLEKRIVFGNAHINKIIFNNKGIDIHNLLNTGLCGVLQAIYTFESCVTIHGFSFDMEKKKYHYYENKEWVYNPKAVNHEVEVVKFLKDNGLLNFLVEEEENHFNIQGEEYWQTK